MATTLSTSYFLPLTLHTFIVSYIDVLVPPRSFFSPPVSLSYLSVCLSVSLSLSLTHHTSSPVPCATALSFRRPLKFLPSCLLHLFLFLRLCPRMNTVVTSFTLFALQIFFESSVPIIHTLQWLCLITPLRRPLLTPQRSVFC